MEDKKLFYKDVLQRDITILRTAANTLEGLNHRWPELNEKIETAIGILGSELVKISEVLLAKGWKGYIIEPLSSIPDALFGGDPDPDTVKMIEAEQLAKEVEVKRLEKEEALAEKKRLADEKAKKKAELEAQIADLEVVP